MSNISSLLNIPGLLNLLNIDIFVSKNVLYDYIDTYIFNKTQVDNYVSNNDNSANDTNNPIELKSNFQESLMPIPTISNSSSYNQDNDDSNDSLTLIISSTSSPKSNHSQNQNLKHFKILNNDTKINNDNNKKDMLVSVGKNLKIKKPIFPKSKDKNIKNDTATEFNNLNNNKKLQNHTHNHNHQMWPNSPPPSLQPFSPFIHEFNNNNHILEIQSQQQPPPPPPISFISNGLPSPFLIPSSNNNNLPNLSQSPPIFPPQMIYCNLPIFQQQRPLTPIPSNIMNQQNLLYTSNIAQEKKLSISSKDKLIIKKSTIKKQLEYYFSTENLCKDTYLRSLFDLKDGKIELLKLLKFKRLQILTSNGKYNYLIIEVINEIEILELLDNNKFLRLKNWQNWILKH
ncbi:LARP4 [Candida jiufengensis]|uniref:LARP4 n=1 Tax=Candida jiufengensis TaxID=497108 RepID=UPI002224DAD9|nr:LARP4 [Candida jiufengensis]KAI5952912.1 LARP4 [Candida jiufengensis]